MWDRVKHALGASSAGLSPAQLEWIISRFRFRWPIASPPRDGWVGDRNPWDATEHIQHLIRRLGNDSTHDASDALARLVATPPDGYTETIRFVASEQKRIRVESTYTPPSLATIAAIIRDAPPVSAYDLQALLAEELAVVQARVKSDDIDSWRGFFNDADVPHKEERCRDHLLLLLRQSTTGITFTPELHVSCDKEVDIACLVGRLQMLIEVTGQWHPKLWRAADTQLAGQYANDWCAHGHGIYLVLWFGNQVPKHERLYPPGRGIVAPQTPEQLREMLSATSWSTREGRIDVFVLDLSRSREN